jgi:AcrR family transcriptional regulator
MAMAEKSEPAIKRGRKYAEVIAGAREVFLRDGFEGASVDDIARVAGVSKATLYSYFSDKRVLFQEVARNEFEVIAERATQSIDRNAPARQVLTQAAFAIISYNTSPMGISFYRMCLAEAERFPDIGKAYYESGPAVAHREISAFLEEAHARGELQIDDPLRAAKVFLSLCRSDLHIRLLLAVTDQAKMNEVNEIVKDSVEVFLARYSQQDSEE